MFSASIDFQSILGTDSMVEHAILQNIATYGFVTKHVCKDIKTLRDLTPTNLSFIMLSLTERKIVVVRSLHHGQNYFAFSRETELKLGFPDRLGKPLCEQSKIRALARLIFFNRHRFGFAILDKHQLGAKLGMPCHGLPIGFYCNPTALAFLGFLRVDTHVHSSPDRSSQILRSDINRLISIKRIEERFRAKQFEFTWVTATQRRAQAVMQRFRKYDRVGGAPINVVVIPELIPLVTSIVI